MEQGFLMMEDPFLASDDERLREQLIILRNFVEEGWQVIIFTAKDDLKAELVQSGDTLIRELKRIS